ncbi:histidine kinase [Streptomyces sp. NPDC058685]|uniref:histidine kinase n=1 Tax=Streptomyces sp. NPDC058685 TaxID=3346598 RepID=UPI003662294F
MPDELAAARKELLDCGLIEEDGKLSHLLLPLMKTVLTPGVVISLEAAGRQGALHHGMLIGDEHVVVHEAWPGEAEAEYSCIEPKMLVWKLADMVNLQQAPAAQEAALSEVETTIGAVEAGLAVLEGDGVVRSADDEREMVRRALATGGSLSEPALTVVTGLISDLRSSWRLTAAWQARHDGQDGVETRGFAVWDCGPLGYWLRELPTEPVPAERITPVSTFRLVLVDAKTVWMRITGLLPDQGELREATTHRR